MQEWGHHQCRAHLESKIRCGESEPLQPEIRDMHEVGRSARAQRRGELREARKCASTPLASSCRPVGLTEYHGGSPPRVERVRTERNMPHRSAEHVDAVQSLARWSTDVASRRGPEVLKIEGVAGDHC